MKIFSLLKGGTVTLNMTNISSIEDMYDCENASVIKMNNKDEFEVQGSQSNLLNFMNSCGYFIFEEYKRSKNIK